MSRKCMGCGIELQDVDSNLDGYVSCEDYSLCMRCFRLKNYGENKIVDKNNIDYLAIINKINKEDLVVYVSSLLTLNLDSLDRFDNVLLILTKRDIMPKSIKDEKIVKYVKDRYKVLDVLVVSAYKKFNLDRLYNAIVKFGNNKKVYFVGSTNSGKSTLINEMIKSYSDECHEITTSFYPSTTLDIIPVKVGDLLIYDTPGLLVEASPINNMNSKMIKKLNSKKEIKPVTFQIEGSGSIIVDNLFRLDYKTVKSSLTFYMSNNVDICKCSINNPRMKDCEYIYKLVPDNHDVVFEDIGFVKVTSGVEIYIYSEIKHDIRIRKNLI